MPKVKKAKPKKKAPAKKRAAKKVAPKRKPKKKAVPKGRGPSSWLKRQAAGRPSKLDDEVAKTFISYIEKGHYIEHAAPLAGVTPRTVFIWLRRGADEPGSPYEEFLFQTRKAQAQSVEDDLAVITRRGDGWQACAWKLERRLARFWGRVDYLEMTDREPRIDGDDLTNRELLARKLKSLALEPEKPAESNGRAHRNGKRNGSS